MALSGGELLSAISNSIVSLLREYYGRGPVKAKSYVLDDLVVVVLRNGFTAIEKTMMDRGKQEEVVDMRHEFQLLMQERYKGTIEDLTGRKVVAFLSQAHVDPELTVEIFMLDLPAPGFGAVEVIEPAPDLPDNSSEENPQ